MIITGINSKHNYIQIVVIVVPIIIFVIILVVVIIVVVVTWLVVRKKKQRSESAIKIKWYYLIDIRSKPATGFNVISSINWWAYWTKVVLIYFIYCMLHCVFRYIDIPSSPAVVIDNPKVKDQICPESVW